MEHSVECSCGKIKVLCNFPLPIEEYQARECDCDFCVKHGLAYFSDVNGKIRFYPKEAMIPLTQGSQQATFWQCKNCKDIVAVTASLNGETRGAVSKSLFEKVYTLKPSLAVSPKKLSPLEKTERWPTVWSTLA